jgi:hypothetical protein
VAVPGSAPASGASAQESAMEEWKPIETAPKDGRQIRVKRDDSEETVVWAHALNDWAVGRQPRELERATLLSWEPTHWRPVHP